MKTSRTELEVANNLVPKIGTEEGIEKHREGMSVFIDVRDGLEIRETGTIKG
ncbi:MAG: rhodanese, partial [Alphaproteobacteria bacterium]|nr:rhodanese [Alphaproteobacteria bacterium]